MEHLTRIHLKKIATNTWVLYQKVDSPVAKGKPVEDHLLTLTDADVEQIRDDYVAGTAKPWPLDVSPRDAVATLT